MFIRKLYYDLETGVVLASVMRQGGVSMTTFAEDVTALPELTGRTETDTGCMVWTKPDTETEAAFAAATGMNVDVTVTPHAIMFDYTPVEPEPNPVTKMENALNELGVQTREEVTE